MTHLPHHLPQAEEPVEPVEVGVAHLQHHFSQAEEPVEVGVAHLQHHLPQAEQPMKTWQPQSADPFQLTHQQNFHHQTTLDYPHQPKQCGV